MSEGVGTGLISSLWSGAFPCNLPVWSFTSRVMNLKHQTWLMNIIWYKSSCCQHANKTCRVRVGKAFWDFRSEEKLGEDHRGEWRDLLRREPGQGFLMVTWRILVFLQETVLQPGLCSLLSSVPSVPNEH